MANTDLTEPLTGIPRQYTVETGPSTIEPNTPQAAGPSITPSVIRRLNSDMADNLLFFGRPYFATAAFWKQLLLSGVVGVVMGFLALGYFWTFYAVLNNWIYTDQYAYDVTHFSFRKHNYMIYIPACFGLLIGTVKVLPLGRFSFPDKIHGFLRKITSLEAHPNEAPIVVFVAVLTQSSGATAGPEAALGWIGTAFATVVWDELVALGERNRKSAESESAESAGGAAPAEPTRLQKFWREPTRKMSRSVVALDALAAGLSAMFSTPLISVLLMLEMGLAAGSNVIVENYVERLTSAVFGGVFAWVIFNVIGEKDIIPLANPAGFNHIINAGSSWDEDQCLAHDKSGHPDNLQHLGTAALLGVVSAAIGFCLVTVIGQFVNFSKWSGRAAREAGPKWKTLHTFGLPCVYGVAVGVVGYWLPLTYGDGAFQLPYITKNVFDYENGLVDNQYTADYLALTCVADILLLGMSQGFGFVGGQIFPTLFIGYLCGMITYLRYDIPYAVAVPCMFTAIPCAFIPAPVTFVLLSVIQFGLNGIQTTYVVIAAISAFGANAGCGLMQFLMLRKIRKDIAAARAESGPGDRPEGDFSTGFGDDGAADVAASARSRGGGSSRLARGEALERAHGLIFGGAFAPENMPSSQAVEDSLLAPTSTRLNSNSSSRSTPRHQGTYRGGVSLPRASHFRAGSRVPDPSTATEDP